METTFDLKQPRFLPVPLKTEESFSYSQVSEHYRLIYKKVISNRNLR